MPGLKDERSSSTALEELPACVPTGRSVIPPFFLASRFLAAVTMDFALAILDFELEDLRVLFLVVFPSVMIECV